MHVQHMVIISALRKPRQENLGFSPSLDFITTLLPLTTKMGEMILCSVEKTSIHKYANGIHGCVHICKTSFSI